MKVGRALRAVGVGLVVTSGAACMPGAVRLGVDTRAMNAKASPCDDFFEFACGQWLARTEIPGDRPAWSRGFAELAGRNDVILRAHLERKRTPPGGATPALQKARHYYGACMNRGAVEAAGVTPLAPRMSTIDAVRDAATLADAVAALHNLGIWPLFHFGPTQDLKDASKVTGEVDQAGLGLPDRDYYLKDDARTAGIRVQYQGHVGRMLALAGASVDASLAQASTIVAIEKALAEASRTKVERREPALLHNRLERAGLAEKAPAFPWERYLAARGAAGVHEINVTAPAFVARVGALVGTRSSADWRAYLRSHLLRAVSDALPRRFVIESFEMSRVFSGAKTILPRWKRCLGSTDRGVGEALAPSFVQETFGAQGKERALAMVHGIEAAFADRAKALAWMDDETRGRAMEKLKSIANQIGYPQQWREYPFEVSRRAYLENALRARAHETARQLAKIGKPVDRGEWHMTPPTVNAYYQQQLNQMVFPAGILQPPFFHRDAPAATNYGAIGMVVGHELTHGFDDKGRKFDPIGNLRDWWTEASGAKFKARAQCVVRQFEEYEPLPGVKLDGKLMLGENIADLGGLKLAYDAFQRSEAKASATARDGFSPEQQFFLGYAQAWCFKARPAYARLLAKVDPHAPARFRVNGPLSNLGTFARAFQCKAGDKMVRPPEKKCAVW